MNTMAPPRPTELDACRVRASRADARVGPEIGPGLILVATLSDEWGSYRTPDGKAVYFTLAFHPDI
jgi:hypothetical protein